MAGERVPTGDDEPAAASGERAAHASAGSSSPTADGDRPTATTARTAGDAGNAGRPSRQRRRGRPPTRRRVGERRRRQRRRVVGRERVVRRPADGGDSEFAEVDDLGQRLGSLGVREGEDYDAGDYGLLFHSEADAEELAEEVEGPALEL